MKISKTLSFPLILLLGFFFSSNLIAQDFITPVVNCVSYDEATGNYTAYFGYINEHDETIIIANGKDNKLTPGKHKGQPTEFLPGTHSFVFEITFNGADLTWHIDSDPFHVLVKSSTANASFRACQDVSTNVVNINDLQPLPGVTVTAIDANLETVTNTDGYFGISPIASDDTIKFSLDGYLPLYIPVPEIGSTPIFLQPEINGLEPIFAALGYTPGTGGTGGGTGSGAFSGVENDLLWPELNYLAEQFSAGFIFGSNDIFQIDSTDNTVLIEVWANENASIPSLRSILTAMGLRDEIAGGSNLLITGWFPIDDLLLLNDEEALINFVRPVFTPITSQGLATSQADSALRADWARNGYQLGGKGVKIGVLSDSYDALGNKAAAIVANGDLPGSANSGNLTAVEVLRDNPRGSNEGMGMLEIIHDVAPEATLGFRTGFLSPGDMANGIRELADASYDVIVDDITYLTEPFEPTGQIAQSVNYAANLGVHYLSSAGNFGGNSYGGKFSPSNASLPYTYLPTTSTYAHDFGGGDIFQQISLIPGTYIMELQWDDAFYSQNELPGTAYDLDVWIVDGYGNLLYSGNRHNTGEDPIEITAFRITEECIINIMITGEGIPAGLDFQYVIFKGEGWEFREFGANSSTIIGHAGSENLASVGAIFYGYTPEFSSNASLFNTNPYSSRGGNLMGVSLVKPDFIAADGANTTSFGTDIQFDADNFPNFFGTSAAAPHAAGVMAIMLEAYDRFYDNSTDNIKNEISSLGMRDQLSNHAIDLDEPGHDLISGAGLIDVQASLRNIANPTPQNIQLSIPEDVSPGNENFELVVQGDYLTSNVQLFLGDQSLTITNRTEVDDVSTQLTTTIDPFSGNPGVYLYNTALEGTNGRDGGSSDTVYFYTVRKQTITISASDTTKVYGSALPEFTNNTSPSLPEDVVNLLPHIVFSTPANSLTTVGTYFIEPHFELQSNGDSAVLDPSISDGYEFEFKNAALIINPLPLTITPINQSITYGEALAPIAFHYDFGEGYDIVYPDSVLAMIQTTHENQLAQDTVAILNRGLAIVNRGLAIVNGSAWTISETALNRGLAIVNGTNVVKVEADLLEEYNATPSGTLVNRGLAIVNTKELADGNALISLTDEDGNVIGNRGLAIVNRGLAIVNRGLAIVNEVTGETATEKTAMIVSEEDSDINVFKSINFITGLEAADETDPQYIVPGALFSENFLVTYEVGELWIDKASLTISARDTVINEGGNLPPFNAEIEGFLFNENFNSVFGETTQIDYLVDPVYNGAAGTYQIIPNLDEPINYSIESINGMLYVNPTSSGSRIKVHLECHEHLQNDPEGSTVRGYFSYENRDNTPWYIPQGRNNKMVGVDSYEGELPTVFLPGKHIFAIEWDGSKVNWQLVSNGRDKTNFASSENANSYGCSFADEYLSAGTYIYYPNPTKNYTNIAFTEGKISEASFTTYDSYGYPVPQPVYRDDANNKVTLDFNNLQLGIYHIIINHNGNITSFRIQKE